MTWLRWLFRPRDQERITRAVREQAAVLRSGVAREPMLRRLEERNNDNGFADAFRAALGGD